MRRAQQQVYEESVAQFFYAIGQPAHAPFFDFFQLGLLFIHSVLQRGNQFVDIRLRRIRPADKNQIIQSLFHFSSFLSLLHELASSASSPGGASRWLKCDIAAPAPLARIISTASAAFRIIPPAISRISFPIGARTYAAKSPGGNSGPTPSRTRKNLSVPSAPITDLRPLCPPALPCSRMRTVPHGKATSSLMMITCAGSAPYRSTKSATAWPLAFMNVCGFASATSCPTILPRPT